jgi:hypothetical protein
MELQCFKIFDCPHHQVFVLVPDDVGSDDFQCIGNPFLPDKADCPRKLNFLVMPYTRYTLKEVMK